MTVRHIAGDVLAEDRLLWQFWINKGLKSAPLAARLAQLGPDTQWDYLAGNALHGGFEAELLRLLQTSAAAPAGFLDSLRTDVAGSRHRVTPCTPEGRLLVLCASPKMNAAEDLEASGLASGSIDWTAFVRAAARGNITLAVQHNLARLGLDARLTRGLDLVLSRRARGIAARNRRMKALYEEIRLALGAEGIRPILLKATALARSHYGDGRLRMMGDLDLLFEEPDLDRVVRLLAALGYRRSDVIWSKEHDRAHHHHHHHHHHLAPMVSEDLAAKIEPHRTIALPVPEPSGLVSAMAARAVRIGDGSRAFTPTDTLFHLTMDLFGGAFLGKIGELCDAREVVRQGGVEWRALQAQADSAGAGAHLAFSLEMLKRIDVPVPDGVIAGLKQENPSAFAAGRLARMAERNVFGYVRSRSILSRSGQGLLFSALMLPEGGSRRFGFLIKNSLSLRRWTGSRRMP